MSELITAETETTAVESPPQELAGTAPAPPPRIGRFEYRWVALAVVLSGTIMTILDATIVNIAVPTLQHDFHAGSYTDIAWVVTGYLLAQGAVIPATGWATDRFGTKRLYLITMVLFTLASAACGLAQTLPELIFFRVLQGIGGGMLMPIGMTIILQAVGPGSMGKVMGIFGVPMLIAPALGPVLGGWFIQDFSWRLIFYVNVPIGIIGFLAASRFLIESGRSHKLRLDYIGLLTATPAVLALMYAVDRSNELGWGSPLVVGLIALSIVLSVAFVLRQRRAEEPLLHLELFRDSTFSWAMVLSFLIVTSLFGAMLLLPLYLQQVHGYDAITTGLLLLPQGATAAISMPVGGFLTDRYGPRPVVSTGLVLLTIAGIMLAQIHTDSSMTFIVGALALRGFAMGFAMMPTMSAALARVPRQFTSRASSITNTLQRVGSSIGIAILVTVLSAQFSTAATQTPCSPSEEVLRSAPAYAASGTPRGEGPVSAGALCAALERRMASRPDQRSAESSQSSGDRTFDSFAGELGRSTTTRSFDRTFAFIAILSALGLVPAWFLRKPERAAASG
ncbi:MAG: DHA2 family efflux MFS transporter permease subunit [Candidatus Dormibacteria bacterium]